MPKKATSETEQEQSKRFQKEAQKLVDAGELSLTEAEAILDKLIKTAVLGAEGPHEVEE